MENLICFIIRISGIFFFLKYTILKKNVTIVLYHDPSPDIFRKHIKFLNKHYNFITIDLLIHAIHTKNWSKIPNNSLIITFDDGHIGNFKLYPIFKYYNIRPIIYLCSDIICTNRHFWWKEVAKNEIESLKIINNEERLSILKNKYDFNNFKEYKFPQSLSKNNLISLKEQVDFGSHSRFHPILTQCDTFEINKEIFFSKKKIESILPIDCEHFCYPNGDYNDHIINILKSAGYKSARTIDVGWNNIRTNPFKLKITGISDNASKSKLIAQLTGITMFFRYLFKDYSFNGKKSIISRNT
jgi:peptidoglycan/xylan/chitin deacetylase (PgdA/CDA1 family)